MQVSLKFLIPITNINGELTIALALHFAIAENTGIKFSLFFFLLDSTYIRKKQFNLTLVCDNYTDSIKH